MQRRAFIQMLSATSLLVAAKQISASAAQPQPWRAYKLVYDVDLSQRTGAGQLWLPLPQHIDSYQRVLALDWQGTGSSSLHTQEIYQSPILVTKWDDKSKQRHLRVMMQVATRDRHTRTRKPTQQETNAAAFYLQATASMPNDGIVKDTALHITRNISEPDARARAIYEWIVDNTYRDPKTQACGLGNIKSMLETGNLGGKCADINSLFVGLARACGIPARESYGVRIDDSAQFKSLGQRGDISKAQHCRAEYFSARHGWVPVDPADVRKAILQEKKPLHDAQIQALKERLFGYWEMNWISFNHARDFNLPALENTSVPFLMYPYARFKETTLNGHHPQSFTFRLHSRRLG